MTGKMYGVGVGPGDPELLTLRAARLIREADVLAIPGKDRESCVAYQIAAGAVLGLEEKEILPLVFPMTKDRAVLERSHAEAAKAVAELLNKGKTVVFLTLGDPSIYSTYLYLHRELQKLGCEPEIVPGVPSFCAVASRLGVSLGEQSDSIHILPASYPLEEGLSLSGVKVLMKSGKQIGQVKRALSERGVKAVMAENCGMEGERLFTRTEDIPEDAGYYSLLIVDGREAADGPALRIGTRKSALAMAQTKLVEEALKAAVPGLRTELVPFVTAGDRILDKSLVEFGGKGVFVSEIETAILNGQIDIAVHSAKDMPAKLMDGLAIGAVLKRGDPRDVLVSVKGRPAASPMIIGTSSLRRQAQIKERMDVDCRLLRGNVNTRLKKLEDGLYDGIILAAAGLSRLGLLDEEKFSYTFLPEKEFIPSGGQAIIAVEAPKNGPFSAALAAVNDGSAFRSLTAEREVLRLLGAGCNEAVGVYSWEENGEFVMRLMREDADGVLRREARGQAKEYGVLAKKLTEGLTGGKTEET